MQCTRTWNTNIPYKHHLQSKTWGWTFFLQCPSKINLRKWTSQETYKKCLHIYKTSNLSHHKCVTLMKFYSIWTEAGAICYAPISSSQVTRYGGARLMKDHNSGAHHSSSPTSMHSVLSPQCWCNRSNIPLKNIQWFCGPQLTVRIYWLLWVA